METPPRTQLLQTISGRDHAARFTLGSIELPGVDEPDFHELFRHVPGMFVAIRADFTIAAASDDFLRKTITWREDIAGRNIFDVFPENPNEPAERERLETCLREVLTRGVTSSLRVVRYDMRDRAGDGGWVEKFWTLLSRPVIECESGEVRYVLMEGRDITRTVHLALWLDVRTVLGPEVHQRIQRMRIDSGCDAAQLARARERIAGEMVLTGAKPETLLNELKALLRSPECRLYTCAAEWVTETGVYVAYHRAGCDIARRVRYFAEGTLFPGCEDCGNDVLYRLSHTLSD